MATEEPAGGRRTIVAERLHKRKRNPAENDVGEYVDRTGKKRRKQKLKDIVTVTAEAEETAWKKSKKGKRSKAQGEVTEDRSVAANELKEAGKFTDLEGETNGAKTKDKKRKDRKARHKMGDTAEDDPDQQSSAKSDEQGARKKPKGSTKADDTEQAGSKDPGSEERGSRNHPREEGSLNVNEDADDNSLNPELEDSHATEPSSADKLQGDPPAGHALILQKLRKSMQRAQQAAAIKAADLEPEKPTSTDPAPPEEAPIISTGLETLPQPAPVSDIKPVSAFSALPQWLQKPITVSPTASTPFTSITGLSPKFLKRLGALAFTSAFAVQSAVLPLLLDDSDSRDLCISAATGSGKTLAYTLPIIQSLSFRQITRLRAIIVAPTRELVQQVHQTASQIAVGTGLKIATAIGSRPLATEQSLLVSDDPAESPSKCDILIATPGRLVEHVRATPRFELDFVKWLVVDEADRLLAQSFQEWVDVIIGGLHKALKDREKTEIAGIKLSCLGLYPTRYPVRKVVLSATMTRDVGQLAELKLNEPAMVVVEDPPLPEEMEDNAQEENGDLKEQFSVPARLKEHVVAVEILEHKPLALIQLIAKKAIRSVLVFVKSNEGAARLEKLLSSVLELVPSLAPLKAGLVTGEMEKKRRERVLKRFTKCEVDILICSDLVSRGLDLPNVRHVVNYDVPASVRAYVHRVGRTARAGAEGEAWTIIDGKEARWFWRSIGKQVRRTDALVRENVSLEQEGEIGKAYEKILWGGE